ncbi:hypothetical protein TNCV_5039001 [Trichonephila clavipes]|nr:hypothetical protein TNCV_5039001 [Trichonephila clavipes]
MKEEPGSGRPSGDSDKVLHTTGGLLATDFTILNHGQVTWTSSELAPSLLTATPPNGKTFELSTLCVSDHQQSSPAVIGNCSPGHDSKCRSGVSRPQTVWSLVFFWLPSDQYTTIIAIKAELAFIRKHNMPSFNECWYDTTGVVNGNGLETMECTLQSAWLGSVLAQFSAEDAV